MRQAVIVFGSWIEFNEKRAWQYNSLLYLKITFIGLDHSLTKSSTGPYERIEGVVSKLAGILRLLKQATENITQIPEAYHLAYRYMLADCRRYLDGIGNDLLESISGKRANMLSKGLANAGPALRTLGRFRLNPGYQLCYSLGSYEFKQLRASCGRYMDEARFHTFLMEGGELPIHLIEKRLAFSTRCNP